MSLGFMWARFLWKIYTCGTDLTDLSLSHRCVNTREGMVTVYLEILAVKVNQHTKNTCQFDRCSFFSSGREI